MMQLLARFGARANRTCVGLFAWAALVLPCVVAKEVPMPLTLGPEGEIVYQTDDRGNRVPDFSHAGYGGGGVPIPHLQARVGVAPAEGDDGARIQAAIDQVSALTPDARGHRGAVLLARGRYEISGQLHIRTGGVVLRGAGQGPDDTVLVATGTDRRPLIEIAGQADRQKLATARPVADEYVPVGSTSLRVISAEGIAPGMQVAITRPSPHEWIEFVGMNEAPARQPYNWKPAAFDVQWERVVTAIEGNTIAIDAPLTVSLEKRFGGAMVVPIAQAGYLTDVGIENLRCESVFDAVNPFDEQHAWNAIDLHAVRDGWVRGVTGVHFAGSVVQVGARAARITVMDCSSLQPVSEDGGYRRMAFHARGQQVLFLRCYSESGRHDFSVGYLAAGPNVFLECRTRESTNFSGSLGGWSSGLLFDNVLVDGAALRLDNLDTWNQGVGWNAANPMLWQTSASVVICRSPPGARNWAAGVWGQFIGDGPWTQTNEFVSPDSLYRAQLAARLGRDAVTALEPGVFAQESAVDVTRLPEGGPPSTADAARAAGAPLPASGHAALELGGGWLTVEGRIPTGRQTTHAWWLGRLEPARAAEYGPALTRFAPGRTGKGLTDEIHAVVAGMVAEDQVAMRHHYGLWYDRRRIDHEMIRRPDGDVYPPFYEQPWARSGQGRAWDGLSRYDLTRFNPWYFQRLREFAREARKNGRVLINEMYFQHNILESGAHWVDSPWRPVNCLQDTGFPEPPPFSGDTIKLADQFYDVTHPVRRELHRLYIRQCLSSLAAEANVIHTLTAENSGPLHFMQFWLDVAAEWMRETGKDPLIALSAPKDVQDAILDDPARAALVDVVDLTYWFRTDSGATFAPAGGVTLAPRQHARLWKQGRPSAHSIAGMVHEYRSRFPDKAAISALPEADGWAFVAAGGSFPKLPPTTDASLLAALGRMRPAACQPAPGQLAWAIGRAGEGWFVYASDGRPAVLDLGADAPGLSIHVVDTETGALAGTIGRTAGSARVTLSTRTDAGGPRLYWLSR